jgi:anaerobic glycerol-3-phosphate dehydrogenase
MTTLDVDVLVIGRGAAGVAAARAAHETGVRVGVVAAAPGATALTGGVLWGAASEPFTRWCDDSFRRGGRYVGVSGWIFADVRGALASLLDLSSLRAGTLGVLDLATHPSWSAQLVAENLGARVVPCAEGPIEETFRETAARFDTDGIAEGLAASLKTECKGLTGLLAPPVLGLRRDDVAERMSLVLGIPVGEAAGAAGDPPGIRLERALQRWLPAGVVTHHARATVHMGVRATVTLSDETIVRTRSVVLATGSLSSAGIRFDQTLRETTAGAPVFTRDRQRVLTRTGAARGATAEAWFDDRHAASGAGVRVDDRGRVLDADGHSVCAPWLFAAGEVTTSNEGYGLTDALAAGVLAGSEAARATRES